MTFITIDFSGWLKVAPEDVTFADFNGKSISGTER